MNASARLVRHVQAGALPRVCWVRVAVPVHKPSSHVCRGLATRTSNPAFQYGQLRDAAGVSGGGGTMTMDGALGKTAFLLLVTVCAAGWMWQQSVAQLALAKTAGAIVALKGNLVQTASVSGIGGMIVAFATLFKPNWAPWSGPLYAAFKGAFLGALSFQMEARFPGLVMSTVLITLGTAGGLLGAYKTGLIEVSDRLRAVITTAIGGLCLAYCGVWLLSMFGVRMAFLSGGPVGIGIGCVTSLIAASTLLLDLDEIRRYEVAGFPKWMEWYGGFTVLVSLLWLYTELLRTLAMVMNSGRDE